MRSLNLFSELKRRNVFRAAAAYGVVAWLLIQIATQTFPFFDVPNWAVRLVILVLLLGFPFATVVAWVFELTPHGIKRTDEVPPTESIRRSTGRVLDFVVIAVLLIVIGVLIYGRSQPVREKSIAVLPFENFSDDKANAFFADGIQDDILTSLAKIKDLKVISRTSVARFRGAKEVRNVQEIGRLLGAANILEGSVRRSQDRVRVTVQLLDAASDRHLWAESYDRTITDALTLQGELATEIAEKLRATLTPEEKQRVETKPTDNADAYVLFLRARQYEQGPDTLLQDFRVAEQLYTQAVALDPAFALAHARLAQTCAEIFHFHEPTEIWKTKARAEAELALRLQPNLGEAHYARGLCAYWFDSNYAAALEAFAAAARLSPSATEPSFMSAAIRRRQGRWQEALDAYNRIALLDPQNPNIQRNLEYTNTGVRDWPNASAAAKRLHALVPDSVNSLVQAAYIDVWWKGTTATLKTALDGIPPGTDPDGLVTAARWDVSMIDRDFAAARRALETSPLEDVSYFNGEPTTKAFLQGVLALARGETVEAQARFEIARVKFEAAVQESPLSAERHGNAGLLYAFMGRSEDAIREGERAVALRPESTDALDGTLMSANLALIYARLGLADKALPLLERLLQTPGPVDALPYSVTRNDLRIRWVWDPIRNDPRFQKIVESPEPETRRQ